MSEWKVRVTENRVVSTQTVEREYTLAELHDTFSDVPGNVVCPLIARITALSSDLATARAERDAAVAAGRVLATCHFWRSEGAVAFLTSDQKMKWVNTKIDEADNAVQSNPLALAWVKAAQEASNGK